LCFTGCYRQRKLEEVLLLSGKFQDALQERLNWLYKVEPLLAEDQPVHGDVHTVSSFVEEHKVGENVGTVLHKLH
jgi:hypothetical protein